MTTTETATATTRRPHDVLDGDYHEGPPEGFFVMALIMAVGVVFGMAGGVMMAMRMSLNNEGRATPPMSYRLARLSNHMRSVAERCERMGGEHWRDRGAKIRRYSHLATQWEIDAKFEEAQRGKE